MGALSQVVKQWGCGSQPQKDPKFQLKYAFPIPQKSSNLGQRPRDQNLLEQDPKSGFELESAADPIFQRWLQRDLSHPTCSSAVESCLQTFKRRGLCFRVGFDVQTDDCLSIHPLHNTVIDCLLLPDCSEIWRYSEFQETCPSVKHGQAERGWGGGNGQNKEINLLAE